MVCKQQPRDIKNFKQNYPTEERMLFNKKKVFYQAKKLSVNKVLIKPVMYDVMIKQKHYIENRKYKNMLTELR